MKTATDGLETGVPGLESVLGGGLTRNELVILVGAPGAGKTVLASQMLFQAARQGLRTIIITSHSEGNAPYLEHMRSFAFFDATLIGSQVILYSMAGLQRTDEETFATMLVRSIRETNAQMVLLDGFQGMLPLSNSAQEIRILLSTLATQIRYLNTTILVTLVDNAHNPEIATVLTVADAVVQLHYNLQGRNHMRVLEVAKRRGQAQLPGTHTYRITADGITVFPRLEAYPPLPELVRPLVRVPFNIPELDTMLAGGLTSNGTTLLAGAPGTGKTTLALHWALAEARPDSRTVFVAFGERPSHLAQKAAAFGLDLAAAMADGSVQIVWISPVDPDPDIIAHRIQEALAIAPVARLVIDDGAVLLRSLGERTLDYLAALQLLLASTGITSMVLIELLPFQGFRLNLSNVPLGLISENVILMQQYETGGLLRRFLAVLRMRLSPYDRTIREVVYEQGRVLVLRTDESEPGILKEAAQRLDGVAPADASDAQP